VQGVLRCGAMRREWRAKIYSRSCTRRKFRSQLPGLVRKGLFSFFLVAGIKTFPANAGTQKHHATAATAVLVRARQGAVNNRFIHLPPPKMPNATGKFCSKFSESESKKSLCFF
jgi:hypothetical protein